MDKKCQNCRTEIEYNFCSVCGQKTSTHRYSVKHFVVHDLVHGVFHLDEGLFFTLKELFTRPGHSIREFIQGKRVKHFNAVTALIIIIGLGYFIGHYLPNKSVSDQSDNLEGFSRVAKDYAKFIALSWIPFYALASFLLFRKSKQNYSENLVLSIYMVVGIFFIEFIFSLFIFPFTSGLSFKAAVGVFTLAKTFYYFWFYYQYFMPFYRKWILVFRVIIMVGSIIIITKIIAEIVNQIGLAYFH